MKFILKNVLFLALLLLSGHSRSSSNLIKVERVEINCGESKKCLESKNRWQELIGEYADIGQLKDSLSDLILEGNYFNIKYKLINVDSTQVLQISYEVRPIVSEISFISNIDVGFSYLKKLLPLKEEEIFDPTKINLCENVIANYLKDRGFHDHKIESMLETVVKTDEVKVVFKLIIGDPNVIGELEIYSDNKRIKNILKNRFSSYINRNFDVVKIRAEIEEKKKELFYAGYFNSNIEILNPKREPRSGKYVLRIKAFVGKKTMVTFLGQSIFNRQELMEVVYETIKFNRNRFSTELIRQELIKKYEQIGIYNTRIHEELRNRSIFLNENALHYIFQVSEGRKMKLKSVSFVGNSFLSAEALNKIVKENATTLMSRGFYDKEYMQKVSEILKAEYFKRGFIFAEVSGPEESIQKKRKEVVVRFRIREGIQCTIRRIIINGIPKKIAENILKTLNNKSLAPINPIGLKDDLEAIVQYLKSKGFYFAFVKNKDSDNIVRYSSNYTSSDIFIDVFAGTKTHLKNVVISGNIKTKTEVILREVPIRHGEIITPDKVQKITSNLNSLGIFSNSKIDVVQDKKDNKWASIYIQISEKNSGVVELAPGYRTDLGVKLSFGITYSNLGGMNRSLGFKSEFNQRLENKGLDSRRKAENKRKLEYSGRINYIEPYLFKFPLGFQTSLDASRKRFYSFDANIVRTNVIFSKGITKNLSAALSYQLESISQEDASDMRDNGHFRIGSLTPSLTLDLRDNRIVPLKGAYFNISSEFANPTFFSERDYDEEINFIKLVSRNKFYMPFKDGVIALSISTGYQENLAKGREGKRSFIPRIKVFRLNGIDMVRGFREDEINRLASGLDINDEEIIGDAYFLNLKLEPRIFLGDDMMLGYFIDAGRVYVDHFHPFNLRSSVGLSFKYLTPVGSLDFEYGVKLARKRLPNGSLEKPGEFHISIGFF